MDYSINFGKIKNPSRINKYPRGSILAGDGISAELLIVLKGEIGVFANYKKNNEVKIASIGPGDFFGEMALLTEKSTPAIAAALTDVYALHFDRHTAIEFIREEPDFAFELMKAMSARLDNVCLSFEKLIGHPWAETKSPVCEATPAKSENALKQKAAAAPEPTSQSISLAPAGQLKNTEFTLFPEGHGSYQLPLPNENQELLSEKGYTCPLCKKVFRTLKVRTTNLEFDSMDRDMRNRYKNIEPIYYDVVTCPDCLYSALGEMFENAEKPDPELRGELQALKSTIRIMSGTAIDTFSVFAGYYLALLCAPKCFRKYQLITGKLLLKLSRIYDDCGDKQMAEMTAKSALDTYMYAYVNIDIPANLDQQICILIGELSLKTNDISNAKAYFHKIKIQRDSSPTLKNQADIRLMDIRELEGKSPA